MFPLVTQQSVYRYLALCFSVLSRCFLPYTFCWCILLWNHLLLLFLRLRSCRYLPIERGTYQRRSPILLQSGESCIAPRFTEPIYQSRVARTPWQRSRATQIRVYTSHDMTDFSKVLYLCRSDIWVTMGYALSTFWFICFVHANIPVS